MVINILLANVLVIYVVKNGLMLTNDSNCYLEIAKKYNESGIIERCHDYHLLHWPPLFPWILSFIYKSQLSTALLNIFCFNFTLFIWYKIAHMLMDVQFARLFTSFLAISTPLIMVLVFLWSEALFITLLSLYFFFNVRFFDSEKRVDLILTVLFGMLLLLQRHAGIFILTPFVLALIILSKKRFHIVIASVIAIFPWLMWNIYQFKIAQNVDFTAELFPKLTIGRNIYLTLTEVGKYFAPDHFTLAFIAGLVFYFSVTIVAVTKKWSMLDKAFMFTAIFYLTFWFFGPQDQYETSRFLSVILPLILFITFRIIKPLSRYLSNNSVKLASFLIVSLWWVYLLLRVSKNVFFIWGA